MPAAQSSFRPGRQHRVIVILGPTASGKSKLGVALAKEFKGVVISADSRQVYRGLDIGTAKITKREISYVPHYLLDIASPRTQYSVARYVRDVQRVLSTVPVNTPVFLVGGSPFYIDAVTRPGSYSSVPPNPKLRRRLAKKTLAQVLEQLRKLQPGRLSTIDIANRRRLIRAIEIASHRGTVHQAALPPAQILKIGLAGSRQSIYTKIDRRIDKRFRQGMIGEVQRLHRQGLSWRRLDSLGLEYRWISRYLQNKISKLKMGARLKADSHGFTRRQMTWWKRDKDIHWISQPNQARRLVSTFLQ